VEICPTAGGASPVRRGNKKSRPPRGFVDDPLTAVWQDRRANP
jgi:hypothetical protein